jgi:hypothetical protein
VREEGVVTFNGRVQDKQFLVWESHYFFMTSRQMTPILWQDGSANQAGSSNARELPLLF